MRNKAERAPPYSPPFRLEDPVPSPDGAFSFRRNEGERTVQEHL